MVYPLLGEKSVDQGGTFYYIQQLPTRDAIEDTLAWKADTHYRLGGGGGHCYGMRCTSVFVIISRESRSAITSSCGLQLVSTAL